MLDMFLSLKVIWKKERQRMNGKRMKILCIVLAALVLHESLTWQTVLGGGLIVAGTFVLLL